MSAGRCESTDVDVKETDQMCALGARMLLGAKGIATRSKDATRGSCSSNTKVGVCGLYQNGLYGAGSHYVESFRLCTPAPETIFFHRLSGIVHPAPAVSAAPL